jgi:hypothetical protein
MIICKSKESTFRVLNYPERKRISSVRHVASAGVIPIPLLGRCLSTHAVIDKSMVIFGGWISDDHVPTALTAALNLEVKHNLCARQTSLLCKVISA